MRNWMAHRMLCSVSKRNGYDTSYLEMMLKESPAAFFKFAALTKAACHREVVPVDASFAAKLVGALAEDCGPCTQQVVEMALEAGMAKDQIKAALRRDPHAMNDATLLGFRFADAVARRSEDDDEYRDAVRAEWGDKGVVDLTMALQMSRIFPMVKAALGYAKECRRVIVDGAQCRRHQACRMKAIRWRPIAGGCWGSPIACSAAAAMPRTSCRTPTCASPALARSTIPKLFSSPS